MVNSADPLPYTSFFFPNIRRIFILKHFGSKGTQEYIQRAVLASSLLHSAYLFVHDPFKFICKL